MRIVLPLLLAVALVTVPTASFAKDKKLKPLKDYNALSKAMRRVPAHERDEETKRRANEYLDAWKASGRKATGTSRYALAQFEQAAGRLKDAVEGFRSVRNDTEAKAKTRDFSATGEANLLTFAGLRDEIGMEAIDKATMNLCAYADTMEGDSRKKSRGKLRSVLAILHTAAGRAKASREMRLKIVAGDSKSLGTHVRPIMQSLLGDTHAMDGYDALRTKAAAVLKGLVDTQTGVANGAKAKLDAAKGKLLAVAADALDGDGNLKQTDRKKMGNEERAYGGAKRSYDGAKRLLDSLPAYGAPFAFLGKPAGAWTLEKSFTDGVEKLEGFKGKVVLLDFWATWCPECSFPVVRDLLKEFEEKGLAIVGVTASSNVVYAERYDFDPDHSDKATGGKQYAARLASEKSPADGQYILEEGPYRQREIEAINAFIGNHEMTWPVVLIDKTEPAAKYAQETWPHTVVLDKQGRIRYVKGGSLGRDKKFAVAELKKVITDLLAEK